MSNKEIASGSSAESQRLRLPDGVCAKLYEEGVNDVGLIHIEARLNTDFDRICGKSRP